MCDLPHIYYLQDEWRSCIVGYISANIIPQLQIVQSGSLVCGT